MVRMVMRQLRNVRDLVAEMKIKGGDARATDFNAIIRALDFDPGVLSELCPKDEVVAEDQIVHNMMDGYGQYIPREGSLPVFFGAWSGISFVTRTLEMFAESSTINSSAKIVRSGMLDMFERPITRLSGQSLSQTSLADLTAEASAFRLIDSLLSCCALAAELLGETDLRQLISDSYRPASTMSGAHQRQALLFTHSLLALGHLFHVPTHQKRGCRSSFVTA